MLSIRDETFEGLYPFTPHYYSHQGLDIHYVDEGSGEPVVMVHGDPTWGFLYRNFIPPLSQHHRCIVPDHMGMGKSSIPQERSLYRLEQHCANLEALLMHLDLTRHHSYTARLGRTCRTRLCNATSRANQAPGFNEYLGICTMAWRPISPSAGDHPFRARRSICVEEERLSRTRSHRDNLPQRESHKYHFGGIPRSFPNTRISPGNALLVKRYSGAGNRRVLCRNETHRRWLATIQRNASLASMGHARPGHPILDPASLAAAIPTRNNT